MGIKQRLFEERGWECEFCGGRACDLHEGIVSRGDMMGLSGKQKVIAYATTNLFILCEICNREHPPSKDWAWQRSCKRYGEPAMREWYGSLNLKAPRKEWL